MIPKVIHYCWFGGNPLPPLAEVCIESWKKYCPDYEIVCWDESNFDVNSCDYVKEAYSAKKWAFVSDYARFKILYEHGGLYFDTDVELIRPIDDILEKGAFLGTERYSKELGGTPLVNAGLGIGVEAGNPVFREIIEEYHNRHFVNPDGSLNLTTVVTYTTEALLRHGMQKREQLQEVSGIWIYPPEYFCPKNVENGVLHLTENTKSIHHFDASWHTPQQAYAIALSRKLRRVMPGKLASRFAYLISVCAYEGIGSAAKVLCKRSRKIRG